MYEMHIEFSFIGDAPHATRLAFVAELAQRHTAYFWYTIKHSYGGHSCTLICLDPSVWEAVSVAVQAAQVAGLVRIVSPKELASSAA